MIEGRFGLGTGEALTLQATGDQVNLTREGTRHVETGALKKLRLTVKR